MYTIELIKASREKFFSLIDSLSVDEINKIPEGFNNNIVWNFGHTIVTGYLLAYAASGVNSSIQIPLTDKYKKGTKPNGIVEKDEIEILKKISNDYFIQLEKDIAENKFNRITPYATQTFGVEMKTIEDFLIGIFGHDILHYVTAVNMKRIIQSKK